MASGLGPQAANSRPDRRHHQVSADQPDSQRRRLRRHDHDPLQPKTVKVKGVFEDWQIVETYRAAAESDGSTLIVEDGNNYGA